jgi:hypothetical protein
MTRRSRSAAVLGCALIVLFAPAAVVCAQAPAGTGASEPIETGVAPGQQEPEESEEAPETEQTEPGQDATPMPPMPAGVPVAEAPRAVYEEEDDAGETDDPILSGGPAAAGLVSTRPFEGVFRGAAPYRREAGHSLYLETSLFAVRARSGTPDLLTGRDLPAGTTTYSGGGVGLQYAHNWTEAAVGASGSGSLSYLPANKDRNAEPWLDRWGAAAYAGISRQVSRRVRVSGNADVDYSPYLQQDLLAVTVAPTIGTPVFGTPGLDPALAYQPTIDSSIHGTFSYSRSERTSIDAYYNLTRRDLVEGEGASYNSHVVGGRYRYRLNRWVGLRAGYGYRTTEFSDPNAQPSHSHELDIGADGAYGQSFTLARRTTFSFQTGSSVFVRDQLAEDGSDDQFGDQLHLFLNGSAGLVHAWGRTWSANVGANRSIAYEVGFSEPFLSNAVYAAVGGLMAPRLDFTTTLSYAVGSVGFGSGENGFETAFVSSVLRLALTEWLAASAQYFYYNQEFESGVTLPAFIGRGRDRQGVSVGLTTSFQLIGSRGRP